MYSVRYYILSFLVHLNIYQYVGQASITTLGTIATGVWQGTSISTTYTDAKIKTVTGTTNRITIGGTATDPTFDIAATYVGQASITTLGTIATGVWNGTVVGPTYGGTGLATYTTGDTLYASAADTLSALPIGTTGQVLTVVAGVPAWTTIAGDISAVTAGAGLTGGGTSGAVTLDVVAANTSVVVNTDSIQAAVPVASNKEMAASLTTADFQIATATTLVDAPAAGSYIQILINGLSHTLGNAVKTKDCYFSADSGTTARAFSAITTGDSLYWVGSVAGYQLATTDKIDFNYVKA